MTYVEVGAEGAVHYRRLRLVCEEEHLGLAWVVCLEDVVILRSNGNHTVANVLQSHLFEHVSVELLVAGSVSRGRNGEGRVDSVGRELSDVFFGANLGEVFAVDSTDTQHFFVLETELFKLAAVLQRVGLCAKSDSCERDLMITYLSLCRTKRQKCPCLCSWRPIFRSFSCCMW